MIVRPLLIKSRQRLRALARRARRPVSVLPLDQFYRTHWTGKLPDRDYFAHTSASRFLFGVQQKSTYAAAIKSHCGNAVPDALAKAESALRHEVDMLGSGRVSLGDKIDWHRDFKSGKVWPRVAYHRICISDPTDRSDIKVPWELSRLQWVTDLGRAFWLSGKQEFALEAWRLIESWEESNPVDIGANWACSMEVAIRAINLVWLAHLLADAEATTETRVRRLLRTLYYHGQHIARNLEHIAPGANTNHLVADYLGLYVLATVFPEMPDSSRWQKVGRDGLEVEMRSQILEDGADYEGSTSYHRLVLEMFLGAELLANRNGNSFSEAYREKLRQMVEFSMSVTSSSGLTPLIGDNDDGYVVKLFSTNPGDHRPLIDVGGTYFNLPSSISCGCTEERIWYLGPEAAEVEPKRVAPVSNWHRQSGLIVVKGDRMHLTMNAGGIAEGQFGGHKHNDILAVTLEVDGSPLFVDPGTACYTADYGARNRSRSTSSHNTVLIDRTEQQRFLADRLFFMMADARPHVELFSHVGSVAAICASHDGYRRLGLIHRRTAWVSLEERMVALRDEFVGDGPGEHEFDLRYLTPYTATPDGEDQVVIATGFKGEYRMQFCASRSGNLKISDAVWHPGYGCSEPAAQISYRFSSCLPAFADTLVSWDAPTAVSSSFARFLERVGFSVQLESSGVLI